ASPDARMMTSERLPIAWICATTRYGRRSAAGHARRMSTKNVAWWPRMRRTSRVRLPTAAIASLKRPPRSPRRAAAPDAPSSAHPEVFRQRPGGVVEAHRPVGLAADELAHLGVFRGGELLGSAVRHDDACRRHQVRVVADREALVDVVRDED